MAELRVAKWVEDLAEKKAVQLAVEWVARLADT